MADQASDDAQVWARDLASKQFELDVKGYPPDVVKAALSRAWGSAERTVEVLPEDLRQQSFPYILREHLGKSEEWINGVLKMREDTGEPKPA